jgi:hypothetical protein
MIDEITVMILFASYQYTLCACVTGFCVAQFYQGMPVRCRVARIIAGGLLWWLTLPWLFFQLRRGSRQ